jgi:hypothetical protein
LFYFEYNRHIAFRLLESVPELRLLASFIHRQKSEFLTMQFHLKI